MSIKSSIENIKISTEITSPTPSSHPTPKSSFLNVWLNGGCTRVKDLILFYILQMVLNWILHPYANSETQQNKSSSSNEFMEFLKWQIFLETGQLHSTQHYWQQLFLSPAVPSDARSNANFFMSNPFFAGFLSLFFFAAFSDIVADSFQQKIARISTRIEVWAELKCKNHNSLYILGNNFP